MLVMVYVAGANSLRNEVVMDVNSMEKGLYAAREKGYSKLKVVALVDKDGSVGNETWRGTRLYEISANDTDYSSGKIYSNIIDIYSIVKQ